MPIQRFKRFTEKFSFYFLSRFKNRISNPLSIRSKAYFYVKYQKPFKNNLKLALPFWIGSILTGLVSVSYTKLFNLAESILKYLILKNTLFLFILSPISFLSAYYLVVFFAPNAKGSGIPQVMAALEETGTKKTSLIKQLLSLKILVVKIISSLFMVLGGGAIGREGPTIQIAGSIFEVIYNKIPSSWPKLSNKSFILAGAAAGLAAAFNTPLGGIIFAIEELAQIHLRYFRTAIFTAVIIAGLVSQGILGSYLYLGFPDVKKLSLYIIFPILGISIIAGLFAVSMSYCIIQLKNWKKNLNKLQILLSILLTGLLISTLAYYINKDILGSGKEILENTLFTKIKYVSNSTFLVRFFGSIFSFNVGASGGIFAPSLAMGASLGSLFSKFFGFVGSNANILILTGMVAFLTGITRSPFTSAILVLEMTDQHDIIFYLLVASFTSNMVGQVFQKHSLYDVLKLDYLKS